MSPLVAASVQCKISQFRSIKGTVMQIEKSTDKWSLTFLKSILKILYSNSL